jgi:hypothetical protein
MRNDRFSDDLGQDLKKEIRKDSENINLKRS